MSNTTANQDLDQVIPSVKTRTFNGVEVVISRFKMGRLPAVLAAIQPLKNMLDLREQLDIASLFMLHADECLTLTAALANQPRAFVDDLEIDEGIALLSDLLEVNADFFIQQVLPALTGMLSTIANKLNHQAHILGLNSYNS